LNIAQPQRELLPPQPRHHLKQEDIMSKHLSIPTSRLICLGGAKLATNAILGDDNEGDPEVPFGS
jgi:hypothetical protein